MKKGITAQGDIHKMVFCKRVRDCFVTSFLAMTLETIEVYGHCEERSDEAISTN